VLCYEGAALFETWQAQNVACSAFDHLILAGFRVCLLGLGVGQVDFTCTDWITLAP
jgi:hypothetical protein